MTLEKNDSVTASSPDLKLFVIGEVSADPMEWSCRPNRVLVLAHTEEEANEITESNDAVEVCASRPAIIY